MVSSTPLPIAGEARFGKTRLLVGQQRKHTARWASGPGSGNRNNGWPTPSSFRHVDIVDVTDIVGGITERNVRLGHQAILGEDAGAEEETAEEQAIK
jgi:hypothetical protein